MPVTGSPMCEMTSVSITWRYGAGPRFPAPEGRAEAAVALPEPARDANSGGGNQTAAWIGRSMRQWRDDLSLDRTGSSAGDKPGDYHPESPAPALTPVFTFRFLEALLEFVAGFCVVMIDSPGVWIGSPRHSVPRHASREPARQCEIPGYGLQTI